MKKNQKEWQEVRLGDISDINSNILQKSDNYTYINYLDTGNITKGIIDNIQKIPIYDIPSRAKRKVDIGDIIYSTVRPIQKHYGIIKNYIDNMIVSTGFITIKVKEYIADKYFIYYNIIQDNITNYLQMIAEQSVSTYPSIKPSDLSNMIIKLPPLEEQKKIASILSSLDDKIELNNRMNKILEEMAQTIFKEWFVNFNFPNEDGKPYKDSGGKMIESELGAIPDSWEITNLEEICNIYSGYSYSSKDLSSSSDAMVTIKNFERNGGFKLDGFKEIIISDKVKENHYANLYNVIVAHTDITQKADIIGNPILLLSKGKYNNLIISMDLVKVTLKNNDISNTVLYNILSNINFKNHCLSYSSGTTVLHLSKKALPSYKLAYPNSKLLKKLSNILEPIYKKISIIYEENQKLDSIRDTLLPKLMSGEIKIK